MTELVDRIDFQTLLQAAAVERASFGEQAILADDNQVPTDVRFRFVTPTSWDTDLTAGTEYYKYANIFFQPDVKAEQLMLCRWISAASNPLFVCGAGYEKDFAVWAAETDGSFAVTDGTNTDNVTGLTLVGVTALEQIIPILNAGLAAVAVPTVTGLNTSTFEFDSLGRLVLRMSTTGSAADTVSIVPAGSGSDMSAPLMDATNGSSVAGFDEETQVEAMQTISALNGGNVWYNLNERGGDDTEKEALADWIETQEKLLDLVLTAAAVKDSLSTTDLAYKLANKGLKRTMCLYTEHTDEYPDAAAAGKWLPFADGTTTLPQYEWQQLVGISASGLSTPLTPSNKTALDDKFCSYIEDIGGIKYLYNGITSGNIEKRIMLGRDQFNEFNRADIFDMQIRRPLNAFDNKTLGEIEGIIRNNIDIFVVGREVLVDTPARPATVTLPDADDIDAATRQTHKLTVLDAFSVGLNSAIHDYKIVGVWTL